MSLCSGSGEGGGEWGILFPHFRSFFTKIPHSYSSLSRILLFVSKTQQLKKTNCCCRFPGNSQIPFPVKIFWIFTNPAPYFGQIPDPKNTLPDFPAGSELSRATYTKKGENQRVIILVKLKLKYLLASLVFLYLKKTEFDIDNVSSPYIRDKLVPCKIPCKD